MPAVRQNDLDSTMAAVCRALRAELAVWAEESAADGVLHVRARAGSAGSRVPEPIFAPVGSLFAVAAEGERARLLPSLLLLAEPGSRTRALRVGPSIVAPVRHEGHAAVVVLSRRLSGALFHNVDAAAVDEVIRRLLGLTPRRPFVPRARRGPVLAGALEVRQPAEVRWQ
jgi:Arc/MetJ family transcription regulator